MEKREERIYHTVVLASLLHDLGKFLQRTETEDASLKGKHPVVAKEFLEEYEEHFSESFDFNLLLDLVKYHHESGLNGLLVQDLPSEENKPLALLVSQADSYSSAEREGEKIYRHYKLVSLTTIFYKIHLNGTDKLNKEKPSPKYRLKPYKPLNAFPECFEEFSEKEYNQPVNDFKNKFSQMLKNAPRDNWEAIYSLIYNLLLTYTWCVPSSTIEEEPDISLFDHLKTTSAISACLYQVLISQIVRIGYDNWRELKNLISDHHQPRFVLLMGDISRIQDYIFSLSKVGAGAISKRLRARSFKLTLLSYWVCSKILKRFNLPFANLITASGGNFSILLPNLDTTETILQEFQTELDREFMENYSGEICFHLAWEKFSGKEFEEFSKVFNRTKNKLFERKQNPFSQFLIKGNTWQEHFVLPRLIESEERLCKVCRKNSGNYDQEEDAYICAYCEQDKKMGKKLIQSKAVLFYDDPESGEFKFAFPDKKSSPLRILNGSFDLLKDLRNIKPSSLALCFSLQEYLENIQPVPSPVYLMPLANHIPQAEEDTCQTCTITNCSLEQPLNPGDSLLFECLAQKASGRKYLAMLKADVDHLGKLFFQAFQIHGPISRVSTFSRMLDIFFAGWIQYVLENSPDYKNLYVVYSGGDDLMIIGPWDKIFDFSLELTKEFSRFTGENPDFHLAASITIFPPHRPVNVVARNAEDELDNAKNLPPTKKPDGEKSSSESGRNQLSAFKERIKWMDAEEILQEAKRLSNWINNNILSVSFARNLLVYSQMFRNYQKYKKTDYLRFVPLLTYDIARNLPFLNDPDPEKRSAREWAEKLKEQSLELKGNLLEHLKFIATYAILASHKESEKS